MPCDILKLGILDGVIMVALLLTTPCALELGLATVVEAMTGFTGIISKATAQR